MINKDDATVEGFGDEWKRFDQSALAASEVEDLFSRYFGHFPWATLPKDAIGFDLGCGSGRWARFVAPRVGRVHCIDASSGALDVARRNLAGQSNCEFYLASVDSIPLPDSSMDFGYSVGVLHHVPDTAEGLRSCIAKLKPGAPFLLYLYYSFDNRPKWYRVLWRLSDVLRRATSRSPYALRYVVSQVLAAMIYWPLARLAGLCERFGFDVRHLPLAYYRRSSYYTMRTDALDRFGTRLEQRFSRAEILSMMERAGLERISFNDGMPHWVAVGYRRPASTPGRRSAERKRILLIAYQFPPWASPEAIVAAKTLGGLKDRGFDVDVISAEPEAFGVRRDESLVRYVEARFGQIVHLKPPALLAPSPLMRALALLKPTRLFQIPDPFIFINRAGGRAAEAMPVSQYDAVITRSPFNSAHLLGLQLKLAHPRLRWLAHFSDPWVANPLVGYGAVSKRINRFLERRVFAHADRISVTSARTRALILSGYPPEYAHKTSVIPHSFDLSLYPDDVAREPGMIVIRYLGNFYGPRNPGRLIEALRGLRATDPDLLSGVRFEFYGTAYEDAEKYRQPAGLPKELWRFNPPVGYLESLRLMKGADALLLIDAPAQESVFFPSKLADYIGADRPILGLTPRGTSDDILRGLGALVVDPSDVVGIGAALTSLISGLRTGEIRQSATARSSVASDFDASSVTGLVADELGYLLTCGQS